MLTKEEFTVVKTEHLERVLRVAQAWSRAHNEPNDVVGSIDELCDSLYNHHDLQILELVAGVLFDSDICQQAQRECSPSGENDPSAERRNQWIRLFYNRN